MIKLNGHTLAPAEKFEPESFGLNILERQSTATITRSIDEPELQVGDWLLDDEEPGSGIVWRVKIVERNFNGRAYTYTLEHIVNTLRDISMFGEVTPAMMGGGATCTALQAAQYVMARQSIWTLGDFEYNTSTAYSFNGDDLFSAMEKISSTLDDPWWEYDMSSLPFKLHIRHKSSAEACEMRMGRNISTMRMTVDRSRMYTRIYPIGKNNMHITGDYISQNEAIWGRKDRVETDQTQETEQNLCLWALDRLRRHCEPTVTVTIGGLDLSQATGETLDRLVIGTVCRVPLPAFNTTITERITKLAWRNKHKEPENVTVTLCNTRQDVASLMSQLAQEGSSAGGRGSGGRGGAKKAEEDHAWFVDTSDHVAMVAEAIIGRDGEEVDWSRVSEIIVDGSGIHQQVVLAQGSIVTAFGRMDMTEESMTTVFEKTGIDSLSEGDTLIGRITATAESLTAEYERATEAEGSLSGRITATAESLNVEYQRATEAEGSLSSRITATAESLTAEYERATEAEGSLSGRITATAESLNVEYQRATEAEGSLSSRITATAESLTAEYTRATEAEGSLSGRITATAESLNVEYQRATEAEGSLSSRITATAESLTAEYQRATEAEGSLSGRITATAESLNVEYQRATEAEGSLSSRITATAESLTFKVSQGDVATQLTVELDNVTISNNNLVVEGYITSEGLSTTTITVAGVNCTGDIDAQGIRTNEVLIGQANVANAIASFGTATESSGQISIPTTTLGGGAGPSINFNIAATQKYIDDVAAAKIYGASHAAIGGSWSGGVYTVNVSYGGSVRQSQAMTELDEITLNGTPTTTNYTIIAPCKVTDTDGNVLLTDNVTVSGWDAYENGQDSVTIQKSAWSNNHCYFTKSAGASSTASVALSAGNMYSTGMIVKVPILDYGVSTGLEVEVDTTYPYNQGYISGYNANTTARVNQSTQTLSYGQSVTVKAQYCDYDGTLHDSSSSCTITAPSAPATVYVVKGSWSGGIITFSPSSGTGASKTVQLSKGTESWSGNSCSFPIMDGQGSTGYTCTVNAASRYNAGVNAGYIDGYKAGWNACIDAATGVTCLTEYYEWNNRDSTRLYYNDGNAWVTATGNSQRWVYGGSVKTKFTLPAKM